jgi:hypothetical protein
MAYLQFFGIGACHTADWQRKKRRKSSFYLLYEQQCCDLWQFLAKRGHANLIYDGAITHETRFPRFLRRETYLLLETTHWSANRNGKGTSCATAATFNSCLATTATMPRSLLIPSQQ